MIPLKALIPVAALLFALPRPAVAEVVWGRVVGVSDGDTLTILHRNRPLRVRLAEIDAPESGQAHGVAAKAALAALTYRKTVSADISSYDRYGRAIAVVSDAGLNVNAEMVRLGYAWAYAYYQTDPRYSVIEARARVQRSGLWRDNDPQPPWLYRRLERPR